MFTNLFRRLPLIFMEADGSVTSGGASTEGSTAGYKKPEEEGQKGNSETVTLTKEELDKKLQSFSDQRVTDAIKTHSAKVEKEYSQKIADEVKRAIEETKAEAALSEKEREKKAEEKRLKEIEARENELKEKERLILVGDMLSAASIDLGMREFITSAEEEGIKAQIQKLNSEIDKRVEKRLEEKLKETGNLTPPPAGAGKAGDALMIEYTALMNKPSLSPVENKRLTELGALIDKNKESK